MDKKEKPTYEELEHRLQQLEHKPTIYDVIFKLFNGCTYRETKQTLESAIKLLENKSYVNGGFDIRG